MGTYHIFLVLGGARSGKSAYAEKLAAQYQRTAYIATAEAIDDEMRERIEQHRASRPDDWQTFEVITDLPGTLAQAWDHADAFLIDCLTTLVARRMERLADDDVIYAEIEQVLDAARQLGKTLIFVSNEVGMGIVPDYPVGRRYRDVLGRVNQRVAAQADSVYLMVAGLPLDIKRLAKGE